MYEVKGYLGASPKLQRSMAILKVDVRHESSTSLLVMGMKLLEATMLAKRSTRSALDLNRTCPPGNQLGMKFNMALYIPTDNFSEYDPSN